MNFYASQARSIAFFGLIIPLVWYRSRRFRKSEIKLTFIAFQNVFEWFFIHLFLKLASHEFCQFFHLKFLLRNRIYFWSFLLRRCPHSSLSMWKSEKLRSNLSVELWLNLAWRLTYFKNLWTNLYLCSSLIKWK